MTGTVKVSLQAKSEANYTVRKTINKIWNM